MSSRQRHGNELTHHRGGYPEDITEESAMVVRPRQEIQPSLPTDLDFYGQFLPPPSNGGALSNFLEGYRLDRQYRNNDKTLRLMRQANEAAQLARDRQHDEIMARVDLVYAIESKKRDLRDRDEHHKMAVVNRKYRMAEARSLMWDNRMKRAKVALLYLEVKRAKWEQRYLERSSDVEE